MGRSAERPVPLAVRPRDRIWFIDNLRTLLTVLVVLHHLAVTYTWAQGWYVHEPLAPGAVSDVMGIFIMMTQAFFMGAFFLISAYFIPGSWERRGARSFITERLLRLVVPLLIFRMVVSPLTSLAVGWSVWGQPPSWAGWRATQSAGPLWFLELLLVLTSGWVVWRWLGPNPLPVIARRSEPPGWSGVVAFVVLLGVGTWLWRIWLPVYSWLPTIDFPTPAFLPQYVCLFVAGLIAYRRDWFRLIPAWMGRAGMGGAVGASCTLLPLSMIGGATAWTGRGTVQSLLFSLWEATFCVGICLALLTLFRGRADWQGPRLRGLSQASYAVYVVHAPVVVLVALVLFRVDVPVGAKLVLAMLTGLPLCYALAAALRRVPGVTRIL